MKQAISWRSIAVMASVGAMLLTVPIMDVNRLPVHADETTVSTEQVSEAETGVEEGVVAADSAGDQKATDMFGEDLSQASSEDRENSLFETQPEDEPETKAEVQDITKKATQQETQIGFDDSGKETKSKTNPLLLFFMFVVGLVTGALIVTALSMSAERKRAANRAQSMEQIKNRIGNIKKKIDPSKIEKCADNSETAVNEAKTTKKTLEDIERAIGQ